MGKRKVKVNPMSDEPDEPHHAALARMGLKSITDAEIDDVCDVLTDSLASLGDLREAGPQAVKELRRLRAEVAAKDAEIARLRAGAGVKRQQVIDWILKRRECTNDKSARAELLSAVEIIKGATP